MFVEFFIKHMKFLNVFLFAPHFSAYLLPLTPFVTKELWNTSFYLEPLAMENLIYLTSLWYASHPASIKPSLPYLITAALNSGGTLVQHRDGEQEFV